MEANDKSSQAPHSSTKRCPSASRRSIASGAAAILLQRISVSRSIRNTNRFANKEKGVPEIHHLFVAASA